MILPIYTYGNSVLRKPTENIDTHYPNINQLIDNMFETMTNAQGIGLAAPQVGLSIRLIVIDLSPYKEENPELGSFRTVMINPQIIERSPETDTAEEGCLSIPGIHESVPRARKIIVRYYDEQFIEQTREFENYIARVVQHEYDHLEGQLFTDRVSPIRRQLIKSKLTNIEKGKTKANYRTKTL